MKRRDFAIGLSAAGFGLALAASARSAPRPGYLDVAEQAWATAAGGTVKDLGQTDALLILHKGRTIFEHYGADHGPSTRHISWSMAKSITHALVGIGVATGRVDIDAPLITVPHPDPKLNLRALLTLTDGLKWDEGGYDPAKSDATRLLYGPGRFDGAAFMAVLPQEVPPLTRWNYSTGAFQLAAAELQARLFPQAYSAEDRRAAMSAWMHSRLFGPLGMTTALPEFDAAGTFVGGSFVYASARDYARFGECTGWMESGAVDASCRKAGSNSPAPRRSSQPTAPASGWKRRPITSRSRCCAAPDRWMHSPPRATTAR